MRLDSLSSTSPLDGRYQRKVEELSGYFSESALIKYRVKVEILYLIALAKNNIIRKLTAKEKKFLASLFENFDLKSAQRVKQIEKETNHDVKAVEYFIKQKITRTTLKDLKEWIHFGLTSEDVTNLAYSLIIKDCLEQVYFPTLFDLIKTISQLARAYKNIAMLARTHGQPASPTTLGKELAIFAYRLKQQQKTFPQLTGKLNGAVGNYNAHFIAYPAIKWLKFSQEFIKSLGLKPNLVTTQVESHDVWAELFHCLVRINNILLDLDRDIWTYISLNYLKQKVVAGETGSSTMPHKVNPINFENSEGNLGIANTLLTHLANKLPVSRLQRDLSDSTVERNIGVAFGHCLLAFKSTLKGLGKIEANQEVIAQDLKNHPEVIAEAIQVILRREGAKMPYEALKKLTRGKKVTLANFHNFIDNLTVGVKVKKELKNLKPENYLGLAAKIVTQATRP